MSCIDPNVGKLITLYEFGELSGEDKRKFETHLLSCDYCFQSLYALSPVVERMRENPERFLAEAKKSKPSWIKLKEQIIALTSDWIETIGRVPAFVQIAIPTAVAVGVLLLVFIRPAAQLADLARLEPVPYRSLQTKAGALPKEADRLFEEGMTAYVQKNYTGAIDKLALAVRQDSTNAGFHFYSGLCYLLSDSVDLAIAHFQRAIALGGGAVLEKAYWYLGNAWLRKGERNAALEAFRKVVEMEGDYQWEAQEIIGKIEELSPR